MGFSRLAIAQRIGETYREAYAAAFGPLPPLDDAQRSSTLRQAGGRRVGGDVQD